MCNEWDFTSGSEKVRFDRYAEKGLFGRLANGMIVFIDGDRNPGVVLGETWECRLAYKNNGDRAYCFAWPVGKVEGPERDATEASSIESVKDAVVAVGGDVLFSNALRPGRYEAYRSPDGSHLQLVPSESGDIECRDKSVRIDGLDRFVGQVPRNLDYSSTDEGYLIKLEA